MLVMQERNECKVNVRDNIIDGLLGVVKEQMGDKEINQLLDALEKLAKIKINKVNNLFTTDEIEQINSYYEKKKKRIDNFIWKLLRKIIYIKDKESVNTFFVKDLKDLYKAEEKQIGYFDIEFDANQTIINGMAEKCYVDVYKDHYGLLDEKIDERLICREIITVALDIVNQNEAMINDAYLIYTVNQIFNQDAYYEKIIKEYEGEEKHKKYVDVKWEDRIGKKVDGGCCLENNNINRAVVLGEPGLGKSTALKHWQYLECKNNKEKSDLEKKIPLYVALNAINDKIYDGEDDPLGKLICREYSIGDAELNSLMDANKLSLYLDGLNEIYVKEKRHKTVEKINAIKNEKMVIVVSDRDGYGTDLKVLPKNSSRLKLIKEEKQIDIMINKQMEDFAEHDQVKIISMVDSLKGKVDFESKTHFYIEKLIEYILEHPEWDANNCFGDFEKYYLSMLLARESGDKVDPRVKKMCDVLNVIAANAMTNTFKSSQDINRLFDVYSSKEEKEEVEDSISLASQMNIFKYNTDANQFKFASTSYIPYFSGRIYDEELILR